MANLGNFLTLRVGVQEYGRMRGWNFMTELRNVEDDVIFTTIKQK